MYVFELHGDIDDGLGGLPVSLGFFDSYYQAKSSLLDAIERSGCEIIYFEEYDCFAISKSDTHMTVTIIERPLNTLVIAKGF